MVFAIVALDDGIALLLYGFANSIAHILIDNQRFSWATAIGKPLYEIFGSALLGIIFAILLKLILKYLSKEHKEKGLLLSLTIGFILLIIAVAEPLKLDLL
jgi:NhaP-type Na+/H+ or K+/H+ antiporter